MLDRITQILIVAVIAAATTPRVGRCDDALLHQAAKGNASSLESIRTIYAKVDLKVTPAGWQTPSLAFSSQFWKEPGVVRVRQNSYIGRTGQVLDYLATEGVQRTVTRLPGQQPNTFAVSLLIAKEHRPTILTDVFKLALLGLPPAGSEEKPAMTIAEAAKQLRFKGSSRERGPNGQLVRLTFDDDVSTYDAWLDPNVNWLIRRVIRRLPATGNIRKRTTEYIIADFAEVQPGVFFPTKMTMNSAVAGKHSVTYEAIFTEVSINTLRQPPFPMKLPLYKGIRATDEIAGTKYLVDAEGKQTGKADVIRYAPLPVAPATADPNTARDWSWLTRPSTYLIGAAVGFGVVASVIAYRRRRSQTS